MYGLVSNLKLFFKRSDIVIDNPIFRIHCILSTVILLTGSAFLTWSQFIHKPIDCFSIGQPAETQRVIKTYCWISGTFVTPDPFFSPQQVRKSGNLRDRQTYAYYQWVCFVLFGQALLCYFPRWLWNQWENGLMSSLVCGLSIGSGILLIGNEEEKEGNKKKLIKYLKDHLDLHNQYAFRYWICELLCAVNVVLQMFLMDAFFEGDFFTYGSQLLYLDEQGQDDRYDYMISMFPRKTKCTFRKYGSSGSIENIDALCILPLNIINEKTYVFLWFWFLFLGVLSFILLVFRVAVILDPSLRTKLLWARNRKLGEDNVRNLVRNMSVGDWWLIYMIGRNLDPRIYNEVVTELSSLKKQDVNPEQSIQ